MTSLVLQINLLLRRPGAEGAVQSPIVRHGASLGLSAKMMARDRENTNGLYMNHVFFPYQSGVAIVAGFFSTIFKHPQVLSGMMICEVHQKKVEMVETAKQL